MTARVQPALRRRRMSRRQFLHSVGLAAGAAGLAACVDTRIDRETDLGGGSQLRIFNWDDYIDADDSGNIEYNLGTLRAAGQELGLNINYSDGYDNDAGFERVRSEAILATDPAWDIVVPSSWRAAQMVTNGWAAPLPIEIIENHANIDPAFLINSWDRGCRFNMPWQSGITGIAYNPALTNGPVTSVTQLLEDPSLAGRVGIIGEMRESVGLVMLAQGEDPSRPTVSGARAALDRILDAAANQQIAAVTYEDFAEKLADGTLAAAMAWSGDTALLQADRPDIEFVVPDDGAIQWFDTMVIPSGAANVEAAGKFMNFVYDPVNAARITRYVGYISPVLGVEEELRAQGGDDAALANNPLLFPDPSTRARLFIWGGLDQEDEQQLDADFAPLLPQE